MSESEHQQYIDRKVSPLLEEMVTAILMEKPDDAIPYMVKWLSDKGGLSTASSSSSSDKLSAAEKRELENLRTEVKNLRKYCDELESRSAGGSSSLSAPAAASKASKKEEEEEDEDDDEEEEEEDDYVDELPELPKSYHTRGPRTSVSAEAYGQWNKKGNFTARIIPKTDAQKSRIQNRITESFMFSNLEASELDVVINAMEERRVVSGTVIITQGEDGDNLYVVDSGELEVFKKIGDAEPRMVKELQAGDAFGELALLYNCPRAATVKSRSDAVLWSLDRETFNHIVKDSASKKRALHEQFLEKVDLFKGLDAYERCKIADCLKTVSFNKGDYVVRQGENGQDFFIIEEGEAHATKSLPNNTEVVVKQYKSGDYFGELALLKEEPRAANVIAKSNLRCVCMDRKSFKRVLGPLEDILRRAANQYTAVNQQLLGGNSSQ